MPGNTAKAMPRVTSITIFMLSHCYHYEYSRLTMSATFAIVVITEEAPHPMNTGFIEAMVNFSNNINSVVGDEIHQFL